MGLTYCFYGDIIGTPCNNETLMRGGQCRSRRLCHAVIAISVWRDEPSSLD